MNQERARYGCPALSEDGVLDGTAQQHSADMASRGGDPYVARGGENVARGPTSADRVVAQWMSSGDTQQNILNCGFTRAGVGLVTAGWYWTVDFGR